MNINYSEIIAKANARKDALQVAVTYVERFNDEIADFYASLQFIKDFGAVLENLDYEGRALLGVDLYQKVQLFSERTRDYKAIADKYVAEIQKRIEE